MHVMDRENRVSHLLFAGSRTHQPVVHFFTSVEGSFTTPVNEICFSRFGWRTETDGSDRVNPEPQQPPVKGPILLWEREQITYSMEIHQQAFLSGLVFADDKDKKKPQWRPSIWPPCLGDFRLTYGSAVVRRDGEEILVLLGGLMNINSSCEYIESNSVVFFQRSKQ